MIECGVCARAAWKNGVRGYLEWVAVTNHVDEDSFCDEHKPDLAAAYLRVENQKFKLRVDTGRRS